MEIEHGHADTIMLTSSANLPATYSPNEARKLQKRSGPEKALKQWSALGRRMQAVPVYRFSDWDCNGERHVGPSISRRVAVVLDSDTDGCIYFRPEELTLLGNSMKNGCR